MNIPYYLKVGRATDLKDSKERVIYRVLEILPGALVWITLIGMVFFSWFKPSWVAFFIIAFCVYWFLRVCHFSLHLIAAYKKLKEQLKIDWLKQLDQLSRGPGKKDWSNIYHLIVFPMYKENLTVLRGSFEAVVNTRYPKDKMIVVLAIEERAGQVAKETAKKISEEYGNRFFRFLITEHPSGLIGEIAGKGSNEAWAGRQAKKELIDPAKIPYEDIIVSCFDADTQVYPQYFACLTYHYLTVKNPTRHSFQPIPLYFNNLWEAPFFSRLISSCNMFWQMIQQQRPEKLTTYSSHSMPFKALVEIDFWQTNVVSEDAGIFWKTFLFYNGDYQVVSLHYPLSMDSCVAKTTWQTIINQYKQQRRWAWGAEGIPYLLFGFLKNKKISLAKKFRYSFLLLESFWAWGTNALLILFLGWLPLVLGGQEFRGMVLAHNLPHITRDIMTAALLGLIICAAVNILLLPIGSFRCTRRKNLFTIMQWAFIPFAFIFFGSIPSIDAQTRLMLGKYMGFWPTEKARIETLKTKP